MKDYVCERVINMAKHISATKCTLREAAKVFSVGKSTAHKDMTERLQFVDKRLYGDVAAILAYHLQVRHLRGGEATKRRFGCE